MGMAFIWGYALHGVEAVPVRVEAHVRTGLPGVAVVGLPDAAVKEAKERIRSGAAASGLPLPTRRITVNLSPADLRKEGPGFDLPVALAVLAASGYLAPGAVGRVGAAGEVALDGLVRPVRGMLSMAEAAAAQEVDTFLVPITALPEAGSVGSVAVIGVRSLAEAVAALSDRRSRERLHRRGNRWLNRRKAAQEVEGPHLPDMADVAGHEQGRRALEVSAAGNHHLMMVGPPGSGKSMLARRVPSILPGLTEREQRIITRIHSAAGLRSAGDLSPVCRPFRAPHHSASRTAIVGGGPVPRPGEVTLAHLGVLFLDEMVEFSRDCLEALRQPLEDGSVTISRKNGTMAFPARCTLVAAVNPCPCGFAGKSGRRCRCTSSQVHRYHQRISGPVLDRVDLVVEVPALEVAMLDSADRAENSEAVRVRVEAARRYRRDRESSYGEDPCEDTDGRHHPLILEDRYLATADARSLLRQAVRREALGGRGFVRVLRVARTLADLDGDAAVEASHVAEALSFRGGSLPGLAA